MMHSASGRAGSDKTRASAAVHSVAETVEVRRSARRRRTVTAYREHDRIVVLVPERLSRREQQACVDEMVKKLLAREARARPARGDDELAARARELAEAYLAPVVGRAPVPTAVVWVTNQQHRWGSCTPDRATIRLSHRLQTMPRWVADYVLLHELAHLLVSSHSAEFWRLLAGYPQSERARGFLEGFQLATEQVSGGSMAAGSDLDGCDVD